MIYTPHFKSALSGVRQDLPNRVAGVQRLMVASQFFESFPFGALVCWGLLGLTRVLLLHARGVPVIAADRQRTPRQMVVDTLALACLLVWAYEVVAYAWHFRFHIGPTNSGYILVDNITIKSMGVVLISVAVLLYAIALRHLGPSWRLGIDRTAPGPLVTDGVYRWTRHPIYVAFDLMFVGTFLVLGRLVFLLLALACIALLHGVMRREERFLTELYGAAYRDYCRRVGRYFSWHRHGREANAI